MSQEKTNQSNPLLLIVISILITAAINFGVSAAIQYGKSTETVDYLRREFNNHVSFSDDKVRVYDAVKDTVSLMSYRFNQMSGDISSMKSDISAIKQLIIQEITKRK